MTSKEYLSELKNKHERIIEEKEVLQRLKDTLELSGISYEKEVIQTSPSYDSVPELIAKISDQENKIERLTQEYIKYKIHCITLIGEIEDNKQRDILYHVYIDFESLHEVAEELNYSYERVRQLLVSGLTKVKVTFV